MSDGQVALVVLAIAAALVALAWWDVQRRTLVVEGRAAHDHRERMDLSSEIIALEKRMTEHVDRAYERLSTRAGAIELRGDKLARETETRLDRIGQRCDGIASDVVDIDQRTKWCEQNIRDLGKTPPKRTARRDLPMPFGQKA